MKSITQYSTKIEGTWGNYKWPVSFDISNGFVGINQYEGETIKDRILLLPLQVQELIAFVNRQAEGKK
jgi:hypothetical protein